MSPDATTLLLHESDSSVISPWKKPIVTRSNKEQKENNSFCILPSRLRSTSPKAPRTSVQRTFLNDTSTFDLIAHSKKLCVYVEVWDVYPGLQWKMLIGVRHMDTSVNSVQVHCTDFMGVV